MNQDDDVAPVDALLGDTGDNEPTVDDTATDSQATDADSVANVPTIDVTTVSPSANGSNGVQPNGSVAVAPGPTVASTRTVDDGSVSASDVPVATPPVEGTANRAVLGAVITAALSVIIAILVVRRRRRA